MLKRDVIIAYAHQRKSVLGSIQSSFVTLDVVLDVNETASEGLLRLAGCRVMLRTKRYALTGVLVALAGQAMAASVNVKAGSVSLSQGQGFSAISGFASASAGDVVMAGANGRAEIIYDNGCRVLVEPGQSVSIKAAPPCSEADQEAATDSEMLSLSAVAVGGVLGGILILNEVSDHPASP